jgi:NTP pyrophosphatase (non-canonical NTP hydrolase)
MKRSNIPECPYTAGLVDATAFELLAALPGGFESTTAKNDFDTYQQAAVSTADYPGRDEFLGLVYLSGKLAAEAAELSQKVLKAWRDHDGVIDEARRNAIIGEAGDCLWYLAAISAALGYKLSEIAQANIMKVNDRRFRGAINGDGDDR